MAEMVLSSWDSQEHVYETLYVNFLYKIKAWIRLANSSTEATYKTFLSRQRT